MIGWNDVYKIVVAMVPLYVALILGYGSVKWWHIFTQEQSGTISRLNCYFILPLYFFEFTTHMNPYKMNYLFVAADVISKCVFGIILGIWVYFCGGKYEWCITGFSLYAINNTSIVGVPLLRAMYGSLGEELVIQSAILQLIFWFMILLFMLEVRRARRDFDSVSAIEMSGKDLEGNNGVQEIDVSVVRPSIPKLMKTVLSKLAKNPNCYAVIVGLVWSLLSCR